MTAAGSEITIIIELYQECDLEGANGQWCHLPHKNWPRSTHSDIGHRRCTDGHKVLQRLIAAAYLHRKMFEPKQRTLLQSFAVQSSTFDLWKLISKLPTINKSILTSTCKDIRM